MGWSQSDLARELRVGEKNITNWENDRHSPSMRYYIELCKVFTWPLPYSVNADTARYLGLPVQGMNRRASDLMLPVSA